MKLMLIFISLIFVCSCDKKVNYIYGNWNFGANGKGGTLTISRDQTISMKSNGIEILDSEPFILNEESGSLIIKDEGANECFRFGLKKQNKDLLVFNNYKCHINNKMIDEAVLIYKTAHNHKPKLKKPIKEEFILKKTSRVSFL